MQDYEKRGRWWRPEQPDDDVAGVLRFSNQKGITLELDGVFDEGERQRTNLTRLEDPILVNGATEDGSHVTLVDSQRTGSVSLNRPGFVGGSRA